MRMELSGFGDAMPDDDYELHESEKAGQEWKHRGTEGTEGVGLIVYFSVFSVPLCFKRILWQSPFVSFAYFVVVLA